MVYTEFKSVDEIAFSLGGKKRVAVLSCGTCSNLSNNGGSAGLRTMKAILRKLGKDIVLSQTVIGLCPESIVKETLRSKKRKIKSCDAIVILSCSAGVKTVSVYSPGIPVVAALDTRGIGPISEANDPRAHSICKSCGTCVISFTDGICPYTACPIKSKYGPCEKYIPGDETCQVDRTKKCVWHEISKRVDILPLKDLKRIHQSPDKIYPEKMDREIPFFIVFVVGFMASHMRFISHIIRLIARRAK